MTLDNPHIKPGPPKLPFTVCISKPKLIVKDIVAELGRLVDDVS